MAMDHQRSPRLKPLLDKVPPGFMVDASWLKAQGIDPKSIHGYVSRGWLERVIRGVYRRPLPEGVQGSSEGSWEIPLLSLQWIMKRDVHLGGESALDLAGHTHYLSLGGASRVHFYGPVPPWLMRLPTQTTIVVHRRTLFGDDPTGIGNADRDAQDSGQAVNVWRWPVRASSPERAILEALDELPNHASFDNLDKIFEGACGIAAEAAHGIAEALPQREGAPAVFRLCGQASAPMAQARRCLDHRLRIGAACPGGGRQAPSHIPDICAR